jgi:hypothetical protein
LHSHLDSRIKPQRDVLEDFPAMDVEEALLLRVLDTIELQRSLKNVL